MLDLVERKWLGQIIEGAGFHCGDGVFNRGVRSHQDGGEVRRLGMPHVPNEAARLAFGGPSVDRQQRQVDAERMRANISADTLSEAQRFGIDTARPEDYLGSTNAFIDRALALHGA